MHVAVDGRPLLGARDGISRSTQSLVRELCQLDAVRLTLLSHRPLPPGIQALGAEVLIDDRPWRHVPGSLWAEARMMRLAAGVGADLLWGTQQFMPRGKAQLPRLLTVHDLVYRRHPATMRLSGWLVSRMAGDASIRAADRIVCVSDFTRSEVLHHFPDLDTSRIGTIRHGRTPLGVSASLKQPLPPEFIFCLGSLEPRKNLATLVGAFRILQETHGGLHLVLAGSQTWRSEHLLAEAAPRGTADRVHILENLTDEEVGHCLARCTALVMPSRYEGFGLPILEASGIAPRMILNDIPVFREVAAGLPNVHFADFANPAAAARDMHRALGAPDADTSPLAKSLHHRTWRNAAEEYRRVFAEMTQRSAG